MAHDSDLPCNSDGVCMVCKADAPPEETITCKTCVTAWHASCLSSPPETLAGAVEWDCPDCLMLNPPSAAAKAAAAAASAGVSGGSGSLVAQVLAIESDQSLTESEKARRRQRLLSGGSDAVQEVGMSKEVLDGILNCSICMKVPDRPVSTPCGHNFCLKCFQTFVGKGNRKCANCRREIPASMVRQPLINLALVIAIRSARAGKSTSAGGPPKGYHFIHNDNRPDEAFTTERAKKAGKANACSGKIFVTVPSDHFGPILAENDPVRNTGLLVSDSWDDRISCRQWGAHFPMIAGIAGQSKRGAQSVVLSGGYEDDEDHGEWFLYTGSGGRDLSGNKRTNKEQSFDQKFEKLNQALRVSCLKGYPVRVVRSHKEKSSSYAPVKGVRYDGIYRIEKCWRKNGKQGYKVCRYLFVRCDNEPAPWNSDDHGDRPMDKLPAINELNGAIDITGRKGTPAWDYNEENSCWMWVKPPPPSQKSANPECGKIKVSRKNHSREKFPKELKCQICHDVMTGPVTTPCGHNFCKACLEGKFANESFVRQRTKGSRALRVQKNVMRCPATRCGNDIADFLQNPQVNRQLMDLIESLQQTSEVDNLEDSIEDKSNDTEENPDTVAETAMNDQVPDEAEENIVNHVTDTEGQRKKKRQKVRKGSDMPHIV